MTITKEQAEKIMATMQEHINKETEKNLSEYDKTLSSVVDKLETCGWTLPTELGIHAVNIIGNTDDFCHVLAGNIS